MKRKKIIEGEGRAMKRRKEKKHSGPWKKFEFCVKHNWNSLYDFTKAGECF